MGNHINVLNGQWTAQDAGIGAGVDSYLEYLLKGGILFGLPRLIDMFKGTVKFVFSSTVVSGQLSKSRKLLPLITVILASIKWSPLLSGRGHPILGPNQLFLLS